MKYCQADGKVFEIKHKSSRNQTIYVKFKGQGCVIGYAALDWEEYSHWWNQSQDNDDYNKTMVVYSQKGYIIGKVSISLTKNTETSSGN